MHGRLKGNLLIDDIQRTQLETVELALSGFCYESVTVGFPVYSSHPPTMFTVLFILLMKLVLLVYRLIQENLQL